jgi:hypothetical protein
MRRMLTREENELLCRVGPVTPMGELMREYWLLASQPANCPSQTAIRCVSCYWAKS